MLAEFYGLINCHVESFMCVCHSLGVASLTRPLAVVLSVYKVVKHCPLGICKRGGHIVTLTSDGPPLFHVQLLIPLGCQEVVINIARWFG